MKVGELASSRVSELAGHGKTDTPDSSWLRSGKSYEQALYGLERKGREKRHSPLQPPIEKREGKEKSPDILGLGLSRARAGACEGATRKRRVKASANLRKAVNDELDLAIAAFHGTDYDRGVWARIAWRVGPELFSDAMRQAKSEIEAKKPLPPWSEWPRIFQNVLNARFPKPERKGGAK